MPQRWIFSCFFFKEQKKEIFCQGDTLTKAIYEFYFEKAPLQRENLLKKQFDASHIIVQKLIETGAENGELVCEDAAGAAGNIMFVLEGLKISAQTMGLTPDMVDRELLYILKTLGVEDEA